VEICIKLPSPANQLFSAGKVQGNELLYGSPHEDGNLKTSKEQRKRRHYHKGNFSTLNYSAVILSFSLLQ
jgi:hypothetical protein